VIHNQYGHCSHVYSIHEWTYKHPFKKTKKQTDQNPITHTYVKLFIPTPEKDNNNKNLGLLRHSKFFFFFLYAA
jgi:hypothetical protein